MGINISDVAKKAGVSIVTVSRVINDVKTVREANRQKVLQAMKDLDYQPNTAARTLATGKTGVIGLTIGNLNDTFLEGVVKSVNTRLDFHDYFLALSVVPIGAEESFLFQRDRVDGIILLNPMNEEKLIDKLRKQKIPFVLLDNQKEHDTASIVVDNYNGGLDATNHLLELGHTKVAHLSGPAIYLSSRERKRGFVTALNSRGLEPYKLEECDFSVEDGFNAVTRWIEESSLPTAIFAADDFIALGALNAILNAGLRVPEDVSLIGYDDQLFSSQLHPRLSTVKQPAYEMGKQGVDLLIEKINHQEIKGKEIKLKSKLIVRESTAKPQQLVDLEKE